MLRTISAENDSGSPSSQQADKIPAVARDGADSRPLSATPSILGGSAARRSTKSELAADLSAAVSNSGEGHQPVGPRGALELPEEPPEELLLVITYHQHTWSGSVEVLLWFCLFHQILLLLLCVNGEAKAH